MTGRWDPTGSLVVGLREDGDVTSGLQSLPGGDADYRRVSGGEPKLSPPHIVVVPQGINPRPFGPASNRLGLARHQYAFRCVAPATLPDGTPNADGGAQALYLAGLVSAFLARSGWTSRTVAGSKFATVGSEEQATNPPVPDPDTKDHTVVVVGSLVATVAPVSVS